MSIFLFIYLSDKCLSLFRLSVHLPFWLFTGHVHFSVYLSVWQLAVSFTIVCPSSYLTIDYPFFGYLSTWLFWLFTGHVHFFLSICLPDNLLSLFRLSVHLPFWLFTGHVYFSVHLPIWQMFVPFSVVCPSAFLTIYWSCPFFRPSTCLTIECLFFGCLSICPSAFLTIYCPCLSSDFLPIYCPCLSIWLSDYFLSMSIFLSIYLSENWMSLFQLSVHLSICLSDY